MSRPRPHWPAHGTIVRPWRSAVRGDRSVRRTTTVTASVPPRIADAHWEPDRTTAALLDRSLDALTALDDGDGGAAPLHRLLTRSEAVATSRIEHEDATAEDVARALVGVRANTSATAMVQAGDALDRLVRAAGAGRLDETALLDAHRGLLRGDPVDGPYAGRYRTVQNWIGGGSTPRDADHVPPPPGLVPALMADLFAFLERDDLHPVAQAAIAHAQFESIHPFTDGNGRTGRALVAAVLRARGASRRASPPVSTVLVAERARYFTHLARYRDGFVDEWVRDVAIAVGTGSDEALVTGLLLDEVAQDRAATVCASGPHAVLGRALEQDAVLTEEHAEDLLRRAVSQGVLGGPVEPLLETTIADLCRAGVLRPVTSRRRRRAWIAPAVVTELDAFTERVRAGVEARAHRVAW
ncbi:Fic family protein [Curtobacterium sp. RHCJP20]|uniref:Fic family protein n=1 Tax=Curtobacterium subtropicum TaxID=3055138 RepID=A0ABT7TBI3_9MICO|nr:Fic family protein [Curtobacterium subtropicum]MDM7886920.1 Fic family protein [Curtobacterium subtropicum]